MVDADLIYHATVIYDRRGRMNPHRSAHRLEYLKVAQRIIFIDL